MKILTLGSGFIANHLPYPQYTKRIPLDDGSAFERDVLDSHCPDVVINCLGKTGRPNVDYCETHQTETYLANVVLPSILAAKCYQKNIHFIHIGSGCIYFGQSPNIKYDTCKCLGKCDCPPPIAIDNGWKETDFANPQSFYSKTKYACDLAIGSLSNLTILRIRMPISPKNDERNFINKVRRYQKVIDEPNSITMVDDLVRCIDWVIKNKILGIYHVANPDPLSAAQVMQEYQKYDLDHKFEIISVADLDKMTLAKRSNCILDTSKLLKAKFFMTPSKEALENCMKQYIKNL